MATLFYLLLFMKKTYVFDYETIANCFLAIYINIKDTSDIVEFEVSDYKNDFEAYVAFIRELADNQNYIVSYNGLSFDSQVAMYCLREYNALKDLSGSDICKNIFRFVQQLIDLKNTKGWLQYPIKDLIWNEVDLAAINN